jgi:hypothetical protein
MGFSGQRGSQNPATKMDSGTHPRRVVRNYGGKWEIVKCSILQVTRRLFHLGSSIHVILLLLADGVAIQRLLLMASSLLHRRHRKVVLVCDVFIIAPHSAMTQLLSFSSSVRNEIVFMKLYSDHHYGWIL